MYFQRTAVPHLLQLFYTKNINKILCQTFFVLRIRQLETSDIPEVIEGWNQVLLYDKINEHQFEEVIFQDPNYEMDCNIIAVDDKKIVGFIGGVAREGILGKDGKGRAEERHDGYIKCFYVLSDYWDVGIKERLLKEIIECMKSRGKSLIKVVGYTGPCFFPGIDIRYENLLNFFEKNGFARVFTIKDVVVHLKDFEPNEYQKKAKRRAEEIGVKVVDYKPEMIDMMRKFVIKLNMIQWFPSGWEMSFSENSSGRSLVALKDENIIGWSSFGIDGTEGHFGPIGVLEEYRNKGIGTYLLLESMLRLKELRVNKVVARWAVARFYLKSGWEIYRRYAFYQKSLCEPLSYGDNEEL
jgi:GNAT superfamily N-acetyltransferase